jgi:nucleosome binding factor SPN SPT16 subunit
LVFKDHAKDVVSITAIPISKIEAVKEWLDSVDIPFCESKVNFNWTNIMKTVDADPVKFYEMGGWTFLQPGSTVLLPLN